MENQMSLKDNLGYVSLLFLGWALLCMCFVPQLFAKGTPHGYIYITIFLFAGTGTGSHFMISIVVTDMSKRAYRAIKSKLITKSNPATSDTKPEYEGQINKVTISDFEKELNESKSFGDFLINGLWQRALKNEKMIKILDKNGKIYSNKKLEQNCGYNVTKAVVISSLMDNCSQNRLFKKKYNIDQQVEIAKRHFNISYSVPREEYRDSTIFDWLTTLK